MNRRRFAGSLLPIPFAAWASGCVTAPMSASLRVLTYNVHHGEGEDGRPDLDRLARVIASTRPDLVALQEIDQRAQRTGRVDQAAEYARLTGFHHVFGRAMEFQGGAYGQALLSRWPLTTFEVHPLPNPAPREPRIALAGILSPPGFPPLRFAGTHLDHAEDDGNRWAQAGRLLELFNDSKVPTILAGDFNARPDSRVMARFGPGWLDTSSGNPMPTIPARSPTVRIDYVLCRPVRAWRVRSSAVVDEPNASDHRPLIVELEFRP